MKTIESKIAPNPKEAQIWVDLGTDPHGLVKKYWNGIKWVTKDGNNGHELKQFVQNEISKINDHIVRLQNEFANTRETIIKKVNSLWARIEKLEQFIVTE